MCESGDFGRRQFRVPKVDDQDVTIFGSGVTGRMAKGGVQHDQLSFFPLALVRARPSLDPAAPRYFQPQMRRENEISTVTMGLHSRVRSLPRKANPSHRERDRQRSKQRVRCRELAAGFSLPFPQSLQPDGAPSFPHDLVLPRRISRKAVVLVPLDLGFVLLNNTVRALLEVASPRKRIWLPEWLSCEPINVFFRGLMAYLRVPSGWRDLPFRTL